MRRALLLAALLVPGTSFAAYVFAGGAFTFTNNNLVTVPDVVGEADFAAADAVLEGLGLDGFEAPASCSAAAAGEIIRQNPVAPTLVDIGTVVEVVASSGTPCTGRPLIQIDIKSRLGL